RARAKDASSLRSFAHRATDAVPGAAAAQAHGALAAVAALERDVETAGAEHLVRLAEQALGALPGEPLEDPCVARLRHARGQLPGAHEARDQRLEVEVVQAAQAGGERAILAQAARGGLYPL